MHVCPHNVKDAIQYNTHTHTHTQICTCVHLRTHIYSLPSISRIFTLQMRPCCSLIQTCASLLVLEDTLRRVSSPRFVRKDYLHTIIVTASVTRHFCFTTCTRYDHGTIICTRKSRDIFRICDSHGILLSCGTITRCTCLRVRDRKRAEELMRGPERQT